MRLLSMKEQQSYSEMPTMAATGVTKVMTKNEKYLKARNKKHDYSKCFEMDVAYTLQKDLEEENNESKKIQTQ